MKVDKLSMVLIGLFLAFEVWFMVRTHDKALFFAFFGFIYFFLFLLQRLGNKQDRGRYNWSWCRFVFRTDL